MDRHEPSSIDDRGHCICLDCNTRIPYPNCMTCLESNCPKCGAVMVMEGSPYHRYVMQHGKVSGETPRAARRVWRWRRREVKESYG